jgi:hypothetical protein
MANGQNVFELETIGNLNYTYVSSQTLELEFPSAELPQRSVAPLRQRSPEEIARLQKHPFFQEFDQG